MAEVKTISLGVTTTVIGLLIGGLLTTVLKSGEAPNGSVITAGNVILATANKSNSSLNSYPSIVVDSGAVETWVGGKGLPGSGVRLSASGSRDYVANILVPNIYASGAVLHYVSIECGNTNRTLTGSLVANQNKLHQSITTGIQLRNGIAFGTGSYTFANSGTVVGTKLTAGTYLSYMTINSGATSIANGIVPDCIVQPDFSEKYGR